MEAGFGSTNSYKDLSNYYSQYYFIIKQTNIQKMMKKILNMRDLSPHRSPAKSNIRPVSPIRCSPIRGQAAMSPIRLRITSNGSTTPNKIQVTQRTALQPKSPQTNKNENYDTDYMKKTLKNGVGLFQQLAHQQKIGSEKKQNKIIIQNNINPFEYSDKKKQQVNSNFPKNSFAALIQNVKQIQSIQASKGSNILNHQISFKNIEKSKNFECSVKNQQTKNNKWVQNLHVQDFNLIGETPEAGYTKNEAKQVPIVLPQVDKDRSQKPIDQNIISQPKNSKQISNSFEDVILLIRKASEKVKEQSLVTDEQVKMSLNEDLSFNMNPFL